MYRNIYFLNRIRAKKCFENKSLKWVSACCNPRVLLKICWLWASETRVHIEETKRERHFEEYEFCTYTTRGRYAIHVFEMPKATPFFCVFRTVFEVFEERHSTPQAAFYFHFEPIVEVIC